MPPLTRSQTPLMIPGLDNALASSKVLFFMLLAMSASTPNWYYVMTTVSRRFRREVDTMLKDPSIVEQLTLWDYSRRHDFFHCRKSSLHRHKCFMDCRIPALDRVCKITIVALAADAGNHGTNDDTYLLHSLQSGRPRFPCLEHLTLRGACEQKLAAYLNYFDGQLTHLPTDCVITTEGMRAVDRFPSKVTLSSPAFRQDTVMAVPDDGSLVRALMNTVGVMTRKGLEVLEIESYFPSGRPMRLHLTDCVGGCGCT